jgi:hypothetical protein
MFTKPISLLIILLSLATIVQAEEDLMATADTFAACSGKYAALAIYSVEQEMPKEVADSFSGNSNGAKLAAAVLIKTARKESKPLTEYSAYIDSVADPHKQQLKITLLDPSVSLETVLMQEMRDCIELNPLQAKIANELRKEIHLNK